jgi:hypothetical protein
MLACLLTAWIILQAFYLPLPFVSKRSKEELQVEKDNQDQVPI